MARRSRPADPMIDVQVEEFEKANPEIAEAMRVFGMSMQSYALALQAASAVKTTTSDSTHTPANAYLDGHSPGD